MLVLLQTRLKICWYLYGYITINNSVEHEQAKSMRLFSRDRQPRLSSNNETLSYVE